MRKKWSFIAALALTFLLLFGNAAFAFQDLKGDPAEAKIMALKQQGVISGVSDDLFQPRGSLTYAQAVHMLVKGFGLNTDNLHYIKEPKASDFFTHVPDDAWYARSFIIAHENGLPIPKDVDPQSSIAKEDYADLLFHAVATKGDFAFIQIWIVIADENDISKDKMESIQKLLIAHIANLDKENRFHPKAQITRSEAAEMLYNALEFVKKQTGQKPVPTPPGQKDDVTMTTEKINDDVNKITLSWGEKPNNCYGISIRTIEFSGDEAIVYYELSYPTPGTMCGQIITQPKAVTYVPSQYQVQIRPAGAVMPDKPGIDPAAVPGSAS